MNPAAIAAAKHDVAMRRVHVGPPLVIAIIMFTGCDDGDAAAQQLLHVTAQSAASIHGRDEHVDVFRRQCGKRLKGITLRTAIRIR